MHSPPSILRQQPEESQFQWINRLVTSSASRPGASGLSGRPLRVPDSIFSQGRLVPGLEVAVEVWAPVASPDGLVRVGFSAHTNFGILSLRHHARKDTPILMRAYGCYENTEASIRIEGANGWDCGIMGPAALINAGCAKHSNCKFVHAAPLRNTHNATRYNIKKLPNRVIRVGDELLINYKVTGVDVCAFPGCPTRPTGFIRK
jgi:hypothetical protein